MKKIVGITIGVIVIAAVVCLVKYNDFWETVNEECSWCARCQTKKYCVGIRYGADISMPNPDLTNWLDERIDHDHVHNWRYRSNSEYNLFYAPTMTGDGSGAIYALDNIMEARLSDEESRRLIDLFNESGRESEFRAELERLWGGD